jgi:V/A-type H+/Na+-transporting ATPase subunit C
MAGSPYASSSGRLKAHTEEFLRKETYATLANANDIAEITKLLESTPYGPAIAQSATSYSGAPLLEIAINRTFVQRNRLALESTPFAGKQMIELYLRRWDLQNISLILSSKAFGRPVSETEAFLVSSRDAPAGLFAGSMTIDDFRVLLQQPTVEAVATNLTKFGYGGVVLPLIDTYARTHDIFPIVHALEREYYTRLMDSCLYYQGDEWTVYHYLQGEIDIRNVLLLLKAKDTEVDPDEATNRFLDGGTLPKSAAPDLLSARTVPEMVSQLSDRFPALLLGNDAYAETRSLTMYETALQRERAARELTLMRAYPLSLAMTFVYLLLAELERTDLRRIIYGRLYGISTGTIVDSLVLVKVSN